MNQSKFSLADVLTLLTALVFGFICFVGVNLYMLGNTNQSLILAAVISVLLGGTAYLVKRLKCISRNFKTNFVLEIFTLVLFTGLMLFFSYSPFPHYFNVSKKKADIQSKLYISITQAENMFTEYEHYVDNRKTLYKGTLEAVVSNKEGSPGQYASYGFRNGAVPDESQIAHKMFNLNADLLPPHYSGDSTRNGLKEVALNWLGSAKSTSENWKPIGIADVVNHVDQNSTEWLEQLVEFSKSRQTGENASDFAYTLSFDDVKTDFTTLGKPTPMSIVLSIGAYLLMLMSWIIAKRSTKSPICKKTNSEEFDIDFN